MLTSLTAEGMVTCWKNKKEFLEVKPEQIFRITRKVFFTMAMIFKPFNIYLKVLIVVKFDYPVNNR